MGLKIIETSSYLPENIVKNTDFEKYLETSDKWISSRTGIKERRFAKKEDTSNLVYKALEKLKIENREKIDMVLVATFTSDKAMPTISALIQKYLDLNENIFAIDFNMACSGFVAGLNLCEKYLENGRQAILVGGEVISKYLDKEDRNTVVLFGDGAGAVLVEKNNNKQYFETGIKSDNNSLLLEYRKINSIDKNYIHMKGKEVFRFASEILPITINNLILKNKLNIEDIDYIICHQANYRIIKYVSKKMNIPMEKFYMNLEKYGNTSAASIPIVLDEMNRKNILKKDNTIVLAGFGAGLSWAGTILKW